MFTIRTRHGGGFDIVSPKGIKIGTLDSLRYVEAVLKGLNETYAREMHRVS